MSAEEYPCVTVFYGDVCGFNDLTKDCTPAEVSYSKIKKSTIFFFPQLMDFMNLFYTNLDARFARFSVYNVLTMMDDFMVVSGMPKKIGSRARNTNTTCSQCNISGDRHVSEIASMALDLLAGSVVFQIPHKPNAKLVLRMGFHR